jgi:hypothetical protein
VSTVVTTASSGVVQNLFHSVTWPKVTGTAAVGRVLTAQTGTWNPTPTSVTVQWFCDGVAIPGATGTRYTVVEADYAHRISASVTPVKTGYLQKARLTTATSAVVKLLTATPTLTVVGTRVVGTTLVASTSAWGPSPVALQFQWYRNGKVIAGETGTARTRTSADLGARISVSVTGTKATYVSVTKTSSPTGPIAAAP